jgi:8-oxo-dGTP diphosphatase
MNPVLAGRERNTSSATEGLRKLQHAIRVAAGILHQADGRVLISERLGDSPFAGLWEFPGGKIKSGESAEAALRRELFEELGVTVDAFEPFMSVDHSYADREVTIEFFLVAHWNSEPKGMEGQAIRWMSPDHIESTEILPADLPVVDALRERGFSQEMLI